MARRILLATVLTLAVGGRTWAGDLTVVVTGVDHDAGGDVHVAVCDEEDFLEPRCLRASTTPARAGEVAVTLRDVPPGTYALQAFHDVNGNEEIDTDLFGRPEEGMGFSNDARMRFGPPEFADAAVTIGPDPATVRFAMRYFD